MRDLEFLDTLQQIDQRKQVVFEIHQRLLDGLSPCLICGEVNDPGNILIFLEDGKCVVIITQINLIVFDFLSRDLFHSLQDSGGGADIVIDTNYFESVIDQGDDRGVAQRATSAG